MDEDKDITGLRQCLQGGKRLLVAGSPPGTFAALSRDPRVLLWPSAEAGRLDGSRVVPSEVGGIILTRMLSHALSRNLHRQARQRDIPVVGPLSDGGALRLVRDVFFVPPAQEPEPMPRLPKPVPPVVTAPVEPEAPAAPEQPKSVALTGDAAMMLRMFDDAIAELQLVREMAETLLKRMHDQSADLETLARLKALLK